MSARTDRLAGVGLIALAVAHLWFSRETIANAFRRRPRVEPRRLVF